MAQPSFAGADLNWEVRTDVPDDWAETLRRCEGGFFHSPPGLLAGAPPGEPLFLELLRDGEVAGIAVGVRHGCRLSPRPRHVYFPTLPAIRDEAHRDAALASLCTVMRAEGADEIVFDSFDASWHAASIAGSLKTALRTEYLVPLDRLAGMPARYGSNHRRHCARGVRLAWAVRTAHGAEAADLLARVQQTASERAAARGDGFLVEPPRPESLDGASADDPGGLTAYAGWDGDTLLAAVLIGWANRRAFYVAGGSTPTGYGQGAAAWLHWRVMSAFAERGFTTYNLGGTPASANIENDPASGLRRFKTGFGAEPVELHSIRWESESPHVHGHRMSQWMSRRYRAWLR